MPTSPKDMMDAIERNLPARTGKTLAQWVAVVKKSGPRERAERVAWLRKEQGLGGTTATLVAYAAEATRTVGGGRVTHRIALRSRKDVDAFARRWLKAAYDRDA